MHYFLFALNISDLTKPRGPLDVAQPYLQQDFDHFFLLKDKWLRFCKVANGDFKIQNDHNLKAIINNQNLLIKSNRKTLANFIKARNSCFLKRIFYFAKSGIYRQTFIGNIALFIGVFALSALYRF